MLRNCLAILTFALQMLILTAAGLQIRRNVRKSEHPVNPIIWGKVVQVISELTNKATIKNVTLQKVTSIYSLMVRRLSPPL